MKSSYGIDRVVSPPAVFPAAAWELDNSRTLRSGEVRVSLRRLHIEGTSFRQICHETANDEELMKEKIIDIVMTRGKMHNPITDTGGVLYGVVEEIDPAFANPEGLEVGDEVFCNASLAGVPMAITDVTFIDPIFPQVDAEGYAILLPGVPIIRKPADLPTDLLLFVLNESGTIYNVYNEARDAKNVAIIGNSWMMTLLYGYAVRRAAGPEANIYCLLDRNTEPLFEGDMVQKLVNRVFTKVAHMNMLRPVTCLEALEPYHEMDLSVNCVDIPGSETINVVATKSGGTVVFANFISNYNIALYITEAVSRELKIMCADGYLNEYAGLDFELVRELAPYFDGQVITRDKRRRKGRQNAFDKELHESYRVKNLSVAGGDFIVSSQKMNSVLEEAMTVAKYDCNVLITGDTGVGKERIASMIQKNSTRKMNPYLKVNCASIAPNLMESEFFGYEKGAFTGADTRGKKGLFEAADGGVIFLDEVGELPLDMQAKLLRVIQDGEFLRVGGTTPIKTNVRILSATNRRLEDMVEEKTFRRDLFYRLNVFPINIPPLSQRQEDIPALIHFFIDRYNEKFGMDKYIDDDAVEYLKGRSWPGNIRELENVMQRLMISARHDSITMMDVLKEMDDSMGASAVSVPPAAESDSVNLSQLVDAYEKELIRVAWEEHGSTRKAAKALGISQTQFVRKKTKYGIE